MVTPKEEAAGKGWEKKEELLLVDTRWGGDSESWAGVGHKQMCLEGRGVKDRAGEDSVALGGFCIEWLGNQWAVEQNLTV